jgi:hypothetical protein
MKVKEARLLHESNSCSKRFACILYVYSMCVIYDQCTVHCKPYSSTNKFTNLARSSCILLFSLLAFWTFYLTENWNASNTTYLSRNFSLFSILNHTKINPGNICSRMMKPSTFVTSKSPILSTKNFNFMSRRKKKRRQETDVWCLVRNPGRSCNNWLNWLYAWCTECTIHKVNKI